MRKSLAILAIPLFGLTACGEDTDSLLDNAAAISALSQGEGEALEEAPAGDIDAGAAEDADESMEEEGVLAQDCSFAAMRAQVRDTYDADGDGELSDEERAKLQEDFGQSPRRRLRWARHHRFNRVKWIYDADGSGDLDDDERAQLRADLNARCENRMAYLLENFDADDNGELDEAEWTAVREELRARVQARRQQALDEFDSNHNGTLEQGERANMLLQQRERVEERRAACKAQFDTDGDGVLDADEKDAAREFLRARVRGEHFGTEDRF